MECSLAPRRNEVLIHATTWQSWKHYAKRRNLLQRTIYCRIHLYEMSRVGKVHRDRKYITGCQGLRGRYNTKCMEWLKYSRFLCGDENVLGVNSGDSYTPCKYTKNHWIVQFFIFLIFLGVGLFYNAELASAVQRRESAVCVPLLVGSAPRPGPRRALSGAPCAAWEVLVSFLRDAEQRVCVCVRPNLPVHPTPLSPPCCPHVCSLCLCLYFCFANGFPCTIFLESTYLC